MLVGLQVALSLSLGVVFLVAAVPKLRSPNAFALTVLQYQMLSPRRSIVYARALPVVELALAVLLLTGVLVAVASAVALLLLVTFVVGVGVNLRRGRDVPCGCFGAGGHRAGQRALIRDLVLLAVAAAGIAIAWGQQPLAPWSAFSLAGFSSDFWPLASVTCLALTGLGVLVARASTGMRRARRAVVSR